MNMRKLPHSSKFAIMCSLPAPLATRVVSQVNLWLTENGPEWTCKRLKALRTAALNLRGSERTFDPTSPSRGQSIAKQLYQENSISYHRCNLLPKGVYGEIFKMFLEGQRPAVIRRADLALRLYTCLTLDHVSKSQFNKAKNSINTECSASAAALEAGKRLVSKGWSILEKTLPAKTLDLISKGPKASSLDRLHPFSSVFIPEEAGHDKWLESLPYGKWAMSFMNATWVPEVSLTSCQDTTSDPMSIFRYGYLERVPDFHYGDKLLLTTEMRNHVLASQMDDTHVGKILFLQEGGCKGRIVACPTGILQWMFEPLHDLLDKVLRDLPQYFCVHDQDNGAYFSMKCLDQGRVIGSIDLSSATDRFPRQLQTHLLEEMGFGEYANALEEICQQPWLVVTPDGTTEEWYYRTGQPMGLYASFPLFSLTYGCLVRGLIADIERSTSDSEDISIAALEGSMDFRDLGDDMVVSSLDLAERLQELLRSLGCAIAPEKSFISDRIGEFAGFITVKTNRMSYSYRPYKYGNHRNIRNGVSFIHSVGSGFHNLSSSRGKEYWLAKLESFNKTRAYRLPSLTPIIGSLDDRLVPNEELIDPSRFANYLSHILGKDWVLYPNFPEYTWLKIAHHVFSKDMAAFDSDIPSRPIIGSTNANDMVNRSYQTLDLSMRNDPFLNGTVTSDIFGDILLPTEDVPEEDDMDNWDIPDTISYGAYYQDDDDEDDEGCFPLPDSIDYEC